MIRQLFPRSDQAAFSTQWSIQMMSYAKKVQLGCKILTRCTTASSGVNQPWDKWSRFLFQFPRAVCDNIMLTWAAMSRIVKAKLPLHLNYSVQWGRGGARGEGGRASCSLKTITTSLKGSILCVCSSIKVGNAFIHSTMYNGTFHVLPKRSYYFLLYHGLFHTREFEWPVL